MQQAKNQFARDYILGRESNQSKAETLGHAVVIHNDIKTADGEFDIFQGLTTADIQRVARTYFTPENRVVLTILPKGSNGEAVMVLRAFGLRFRARCVALVALSVQAQSRNWPSERPPRPIASRDVKFPPYAVKTLANGLQVIAVSHHEQPAVSIRLLVRAGAAQDPADKPGVAALAATLLDQGTTTKRAEQIANSIDSIGGAMGTGAGSDRASSTPS